MSLIPNRTFERYYQYIFEADANRDDLHLDSLIGEPASGSHCWFDSDYNKHKHSFSIGEYSYRLSASDIQHIRGQIARKEFLPVLRDHFTKEVVNTASSQGYNDEEIGKIVALSGVYWTKNLAKTVCDFEHSATTTNEINGIKKSVDTICACKASLFMDNVSVFGIDCLLIPDKIPQESSDELTAFVHNYDLSDDAINVLCDYFDDVDKRVVVLQQIEHDSNLYVATQKTQNIVSLRIDFSDNTSQAVYDDHVSIAEAVTNRYNRDFSSKDVLTDDGSIFYDAKDFAERFMEYRKAFIKRWTLYGLNVNQMAEVGKFVQLNNLRENMADYADLFTDIYSENFKKHGIGVDEFLERFDSKQAAAEFDDHFWNEVGREYAEKIVDKMGNELLTTMIAEKKKSMDIER